MKHLTYKIIFETKTKYISSKDYYYYYYYIRLLLLLT